MNTTKNIIPLYRILFYFFIVGVFFSCKEEDLGNFTSEDPQMSVGVEEIAVPKEGGTYNIDVTSNLPWRVKADAEWVDFDNLSGLETGKFSCTVAKNIITEQRIATITAWVTKDYKKEIQIIQAAGDPPPSTKTNWYVKMNGTGDGTSWASATDIDSALELIENDGDIIHIAAGTYTPSVIVSGGDPSAEGDKTFEIKRNITVIGGYPANATEGAESDPSANITELNGKLTGGGNACHVVTVTAMVVDGQKVQLQGLMIKNGNAASSGNVLINGINYPRNYAGGLIVAKSKIELTDCIISDNKATGHGVGIYVFSSASINMEKCIIQNNLGATSNGGGMYLNGGEAFINNSSILNNEVDGVGGAMQVYGSSKLYIYNSTIANNVAGTNSAGRAAGGIYLRNKSVGVLMNCTLYGNVASGNGGAISTHDNVIFDIINTTIAGNTCGVDAKYGGGGIYNYSNCTINLHNTIASGNTKDGAANDLANTISTKYTVVSDKVYDGDQIEISGVVFDPTTMLGTLSDNGGYTKTCKLEGIDNPATTYGMSTTELAVFGSLLYPIIEEDFITVDQRGVSRTGKKCIGAYVVE